jgi:multisubunit Na+/H+ antiporter MnhG subunit
MNIIKINDIFVLFPFVVIVCSFSTTIGAIFLFDKNIYLFIFYLVIIAYFMFILLPVVGRALFKYTKSENPLKENVKTLSEL